MESTKIAPFLSQTLTNPMLGGSEDVVEIGLLLPSNRAAALLRLARDRHESVGQILRQLIDRELAKPA
jgi:hypothetical protein